MDMQFSIKRSLWIMHRTLLTVFCFFLLTGVLYAQTLPVFRIGVLDDDNGMLTRGARLAISQINDAGGVTGADGTRFLLELVVQPPAVMEPAVSNINQSNVIAVLGPETSVQVLGNLPLLQSLNVPVLTPALDDSILAQDTSGLFIRIRAREIVTGRALADFLVSEFPGESVSIVQLDLESVSGAVGFTVALNAAGVSPQNEFILGDGTSISDLVESVITNNPAILVVYGLPDVSRQFYTQLLTTDWQGQFVYNRASNSIFKTALPPAQLAGIIGSETWSFAAPDERSRGFLADYAEFYGAVPGAIEAAAYDTIFMMQDAIRQPGDLLSNLRSLSRYEGVQGVLAPSQFGDGEVSNQVLIFQTTEFGGQHVLARYSDGQRLGEDVLVNPDLAVATPTPTATATPEGVVITITSPVQNVRTGPGLQYDVVGQLRQGEQAQVIGASADFSWVVINYRGENGWLSRSILDLFGDERSVPLIPAPPTPTPPPATFTPLPPTATAAPAFADIVIVSAQPNRLVIGQPFSVTATVLNQGTVAAGPFAVAATLLPGSVYSAVNLNGLGAGQQTNVTLAGTLGSGSTGSQSIIIVADLNNQVNEGTAGEANNGNYTYTYMADAPLLTSGSLSLNDGATVSLDNGTADIQWQGGSLIPQGTTTMAVLGGFASFNQVHRDTIAGTALTNSPINTVPIGTLIGVQTDGGTKYAVMEVTGATAGGTLQFNFRSYQ